MITFRCPLIYENQYISENSKLKLLTWLGLINTTYNEEGRMIGTAILTIIEYLFFHYCEDNLFNTKLETEFLCLSSILPPSFSTFSSPPSSGLE